MALGIAIISALWFLLVNLWEINAPFGAGHWAAAASVGVAGENMWKHHIIAPALWYTPGPPVPSEYYCNHPWGIFWSTALFVKLFGHHNWVCRLVPVVLSSLSPLLLYGIGRGIWGPVSGALSAASFVVLPIALAFGNFNGLEVPVIFGVLLSIWGYVRLTKTWKRRWVAVSAIGFFHAFSIDWPAYFYGAAVLAFMLPRGILLNGRWYPAVDRRRFAQWWSLAASAAVGLMLFHLWQCQKAGQLVHLLGQGISRSAGADAPLSIVLEHRAHWIELAFTPLAIFIGKAMVPVFLFRLVFLKRDLEVFPLAVLVMATLHYVIFKQGADIHFFWPQYFAPYFALSMGCLAVTVEGVGRWVARRFSRKGRLVPPIVALLTTVWVPLAIIPDGVRGLVYARGTGGRFDERGNLIYSDIDKVTALDWMRKRWESNTSVVAHEGMNAGWQVAWSIRRPLNDGPVPKGRAVGQNQYYLVDSRFIYANDLKRLAQSFHIVAVGPFWVADRAQPSSPIDGFSLEPHEPTFLEWYFVQGNDPIYTVVPDPFVTWELRHHLDQTPNPAPTVPAKTFEQKRIAHNVAVAAGDTALAARLRQELEGELDRTTATHYPDGIELLGTRVTKGVVEKLGVYFLASGPIDPDAMFHIKSEVERDAKWSLVKAPERIRSVGMPFDMPTPLWQEGMIYRSMSEIRPRPGFERYSGTWGVRRPGPRLPAIIRAPAVALLTTGG